MSQPSRNTFEATLQLLGTDTGTFSGALSVRLIKEPFAKTLDTVFLTAYEADFGGYIGKNCAAANRPVNTDPATGNRILTVTPPAGGYFWESSGGSGYPQTIYGWCLAIGAASLALTGLPILAMDLLDTPVTINDDDQNISIDPPTITLPVTGLR